MAVYVCVCVRRSKWTSRVDPITRLVYFVHATEGSIRWTLPHSLTQHAAKPPRSKASADGRSTKALAAKRARLRQKQKEMVMARQARREAKTRKDWSERRRHAKRQASDEACTVKGTCCPLSDGVCMWCMRCHK